MQPIKHVEQWHDIKGYEGLYRISSLGRIATTRRQGTTGMPLKPVLQPHGYFTVMLCKRGKTHKEYVHRLVANAFLGEHEGLVVNHKDECKTNNDVSNLEWITLKENTEYGTSIYRNAVKRRSNHAAKIVQLDDKGTVVATYKFLKDAAAAVGGAPINISRAARHIRNRISAYGYQWRYE